MKYALAVVVIILAIRGINHLIEKIKQWGIRENFNSKNWPGLGLPSSLSPRFQKALMLEKLYRAREFFLIPGVIRPRSSPGTDEDDRG